MNLLCHSVLRIILLTELLFLVCFYWYNPREYVKAECIKKEQQLYEQRKTFLAWLVNDLQCEIALWESTPLQKESFAREQLAMARPNEIVYYYSQQNMSGGASK